MRRSPYDTTGDDPICGVCHEHLEPSGCRCIRDDSGEMSAITNPLSIDYRDIARRERRTALILILAIVDLIGVALAAWLLQTGK